MEQGDAPFLSSGTWSLLGVKLAKPITSPESCRANFTNEGGVGYIRYLKNIMGLWIIQCVQKQLGISFAEMVELAKTSTYTRIFDVNAARFSAPQDMRAEIRAALAETGDPSHLGEFVTVKRKDADRAFGGGERDDGDRHCNSDASFRRRSVAPSSGCRRGHRHRRLKLPRCARRGRRSGHHATSWWLREQPSHSRRQPTRR